MNISIVGAGVSGSLLARLLEDEHNVMVYDGNLMRGHRCAFGCFYSLLGDQLDKIGLNIDNYVLCKPETLILNGIYIKIRNQIPIDKPKMLEDIWPHTKVIPKHVPLVKHTGTDLTVNATATPLGSYNKIATKQSKAHIKGVEKQHIYVNIDPKYLGYAWIFPLDSDGNYFHLGAGCVNADPDILINKILKRYKIEIIDEECKCNRDIAVVNPDDVVVERNGIVSIGEAVGAVYPVTGEGIIPSMESAFMLATSIKDNTFPKGYEHELGTQIFQDYKSAYKIWGRMDKHPRLAWLLGFGYMLGRAKTRTMPILTWRNRLDLMGIIGGFKS